MCSREYGTCSYQYITDTYVCSQDVLELVALADRFGFIYLKAAIAAQLEKNISDVTVLQMLAYADLCDLHELHQKCLHYCDEHTTAILKSENLLSLTEDALKSVISRDTLNVAELSILEALLQWKKHNQRSTEEMKELLECIHLTRFSPQELFERVELQGLFTGEQILAAVQAQSKPQLHLLRPRGKKGDFVPY